VTAIGSEPFDLCAPDQTCNHISLAEDLCVFAGLLDGADEIAAENCAFAECIAVECLDCILASVIDAGLRIESGGILSVGFWATYCTDTRLWCASRDGS